MFANVLESVYTNTFHCFYFQLFILLAAPFLRHFVIKTQCEFSMDITHGFRSSANRSEMKRNNLKKHRHNFIQKSTLELTKIARKISQFRHKFAHFL